jgi:hypothetical protein
MLLIFMVTAVLEANPSLGAEVRQSWLQIWSVVL